MRPINLFEYEAAAKEKLGGTAYDYYAGGAADEITLNDNRAAFNRIRLMPRVLANAAQRDLSTKALGRRVELPVMIAPTAFQGMAYPDGELESARAAQETGTIMIASTLSTATIEQIAAAANGQVWFQLYTYRDRVITRSLVERAQAAGCGALVLTADAPVQGKRERDVRNKFQLPPHLKIQNLLGAGHETFPRNPDGSGLAAYINTLFDAAFNWKDLQWLCSIAGVPVLVKGVMCAADAVTALENGAAGVVVSNHGGRQLDTAPAAIDALPAVVEAVGAKAEVYVDGGIRRGTDVLKALALGARAVLLGRPVLWGLSVEGKQGVKRVFEILRDELSIAMGLCGCASINDVTKNVLFSA